MLQLNNMIIRWLPIHGKGSNGKVFKFYDEHNNCIIIKIQSTKGDSTLQDAIIMKTILCLPKRINLDKSYFLTYDINNKCLIDYRQRNIVFNKDNCLDKISLFEAIDMSKGAINYVLLTYGIEHPTSLFTMLENARDVQSTKTCISHLCSLFSECLKMAQQTGFSHGDFHASNILFDNERSKFLLIDYGRSYINDVYIDNIDGQPSTNKLLTILEESLRFDSFVYPSPFTRSYPRLIDPLINYTANISLDATLNGFMMSLDIAGLAFKLFVQYVNQILDVYKYNDKSNHKANLINQFRFFKDSKCQNHLVFDMNDLIEYEPEDEFVQGLRHLCIFCYLLGYVKKREISGEHKHTIHLKRVYDELFHWQAGVIRVSKSVEAFIQFKKHPIKNYFKSPNQVSQKGGGLGIRQLYEKAIHSLNGQDPWERVFQLKESLKHKHGIYGPAPEINAKWFI